MPEPFHTSRLVEFHDTDMAGIMHFASFFVYMESAEHEMLRSLGLSIYHIVGDEHVTFPRVSAACSYHAPARFEDRLDVAISVSRLGSKSVTFEFRFTRQGDRIAEGSMTAVCCRIDPGGQPVSRSIPPEIADKLRTYAS